MTDITRLIDSLKRRSSHAKDYGDDITFVKLEDLDALVEAVELARNRAADWEEKAVINYAERTAMIQHIAELESRTATADADVSDRNQPGMVVAVHIDAGDFVKFRGQVYEVKETHFNDHDVTLWFVCGEALKCAAGCQIEVISAPEESE